MELITDKYRVEEDTLGPVKIPADAEWGPQTERSRQNFTGGRPMPLQLIRVLIGLKKAAAQANVASHVLDDNKGQLIVQAADSLLAMDDADLRRRFPLKVYQTGSGTQTNMNVNEVIAHRASQLGQGITILPNDDVNRGQSSNDTFPTAMNVAALLALQKLFSVLRQLVAQLKEKEQRYWRTVKVGRTHLQDAVPLTFGQELSGYVASLNHDLAHLQELAPSLGDLPIGGTAVGTGLNAAPGMANEIATRLGEEYDLPLHADGNKFAGLANHSALNVVHGALKTLAADMFKLAQDIRMLASGPRAGYGELNIPANEPGSSIMPGKVNPTQAEAVTMAALRVFGNDTTITMASSQGNFEMNVYKPVIIDAFLESTDLLTATTRQFTDKMISGLTVNAPRMQELVDNSLMTVTALSLHIGYHASAKIAQAAAKQGISLKEAALQSGQVTAAQYDSWMDPLKMTGADDQQPQDK